MILLGTTNPGKIAELRQILGDKFQVVGLADLPSPAPEVIEDGGSYRANALKKAIAYHAHSRLPVIADDSGLEVDLLQGRPGVESAYYGGLDLSWPQRWACLHAELSPFPTSQWTARFRCVICYFDGVTPAQYFEAVAPGRILPEPRGSKGFGYDPILFSEELGMSFAEATAEAKNQVSHRAKALKLLRDWLDRRPSRG